MKKYVFAAIVAVMVFAISAFAASLEVDGGVLQAGVDGDLTCGDTVDITWETSNDGSGHWVGGALLQLDPACEGLHVQVALQANAPGESPVEQLAYTIPDATVDASGHIEVDFGCDGSIRAEEVNTVQVLVKDPLTADELAALPFQFCA